MKKTYKVLLIFISLIGLALSLSALSLFCEIPAVSGMVMWYQAVFPWINNILAGYISFIGLCFLLLLPAALFFPNKPDALAIQKDRGRLLFSRQTVESTARYSFADQDGISFCRVRARIGRQPEKTRIYVKLSVSDTSKLVGLTEAVQGKIDSALKSSLGVTARSISVMVAESAPKTAPRKESPEAVSKSGRVV